MMPLIKYQHLIYKFYDLLHINHQGDCSLTCNFDITRGGSLVVTDRTADVRVTLDRPSTV